MNSSGVENLEIRRDVVFLAMNFHIWSGRKSIEAEVIGASDPDRVNNITQAICPKSLLDPFRKIARDATASMDLIGCRFRTLGNLVWVIPDPRKQECELLLEKYAQQYRDQLDEVSAIYDTECDRYYTGMKYEQVMRGLKQPVTTLQAKTWMEHSFFKISEEGSSENLNSEALFENFTQVVAEEAGVVAKANQERKRENLRGDSLNKLFKLREKARGFSFLNSDAKAVADFLDCKLRKFTAGQGVTDPSLVAEAFFIAESLSDPDRLRTFSQYLQGIPNLLDEIKASEQLEADDPTEDLEFLFDIAEEEDSPPATSAKPNVAAVPAPVDPYEELEGIDPARLPDLD